MNLYQYPIKERQVRIYRQKRMRWRNEHSDGVYFVKEYLHLKKHPLHAYVRQIKADQKETYDADYPDNRYLVVINYREMPRDEYFIEWDNKTLKVLDIDGYECRKTELKLTCVEIDVDTTVYKRVSEVKPR